SCFYRCYGAHRHLHSSPTRRSSDLLYGGSAPKAVAPAAVYTCVMLTWLPSIMLAMGNLSGQVSAHSNSRPAHKRSGCHSSGRVAGSTLLNRVATFSEHCDPADETRHESGLPVFLSFPETKLFQIYVLRPDLRLSHILPLLGSM